MNFRAEYNDFFNLFCGIIAVPIILIVCPILPLVLVVAYFACVYERPSRPWGT